MILRISLDKKIKIQKERIYSYIQIDWFIIDLFHIE